jgi:hypothetical protein
MRVSSIRWIGAGIAAAALLAVASAARAESSPLDLKRLEPADPAQAGPPSQLTYRLAQPQHFFAAIGQGVAVPRDAQSDLPEFSRVVTKEPAKYQAGEPFRGVARLGDHFYGFALDTADAEANEFNRLRFDVNRNGDLTDDPVIEGSRPEGRYPEGYWVCRFPRVDLTIEVDGARSDYSFFFSAQSAFVQFGMPLAAQAEAAESKRDVRYVSAGLQAACYREGQVEVGGKTRRVVLIDFNSNGRFDDRTEVREIGGGIRPVFGDVLLWDPESTPMSPLGAYDRMQSQVARFAPIDGRLYELSISPGADRLTLSSATVSVGRVTLPSDGFRATVYGEAGLMRVEGDRAEPVPVPAGTWKLLSYTIDRTGYDEGEEPAPDAESSALQSLAGALLQSAAPKAAAYTRLTAVSSGEAFEVRKDETIRLPFGPPYRPVVTASKPLRPGERAQLGLALVGRGGERCSSLMVKGKRPDKPQFTILSPDEEEVATGNFEYG